MKRFIFALFAFFAVVGCSEFDDSAIWEKIDSLDERLTELESVTDGLNSDITTLKGLVSALEANDYITSVTSLTEDGKEIGFVISFAISDSIIIYHGTDGEDGTDGTDGVTPVVGVQMDNDGLYYWTITVGDGDTEWLLDANGNKVRTSGEDGEDGTTPVIGVEEYDGDYYWTMTVDGVTSWIADGDGEKVPTTGADGSNGSDASISYVDNGDTVTFFFDGLSFTFAKHVALVNFDEYAGEDVVLNPFSNSINIGLSEAVEESNFSSLSAELTLPDGSAISDTYVYTRASSTESGWSISISDPTFTDGVYNNDAVVTITAPEDVEGVVDLALSVTLNTEDGSSESSTIEFSYDNSLMNSTFSLADFATMTSYPAYDTWIISDATAESYSSSDYGDFTNLRAMLDLAYEAGLEVTLEFPNLLELPTYAFYNCTSLTEISLPVATTIERYAFRGCTSLTEISLPMATVFGNTAFYYCSSLTSVSIPAATTIEGRMFRNCTSLTEIEVNEDYFVFEDCVLYNKEKSEIIFGNISGDYTAPESVLTVGSYAFYGCSLTSISLPATTTIKSYAFRSCTSLTSISLPATTTIGSSAFYDCSSLTEISLPMATEIGSSAFEYCTSLTEISLPVVTTFGSDAFYGCTSVTSVSLPAATIIESYAFNSCTSLTTVSLPVATTIESAAFTRCTSLTEISLPIATTFGSHALSLCTSLTSVSFPMVTTVGDYALSLCTSLTSISLPVATTFGSHAFWGCTSLTEISLPEATTIGNSTFYDCTSLTSISLPKATEIGVGAFYGVTTTDVDLTISASYSAISGNTLTTNGESDTSTSSYEFKSITTI